MCTVIYCQVLETCIDCAIDTTESRRIGDRLFWCKRIRSATLVCSAVKPKEGKLDISQDFKMNGNN